MRATFHTTATNRDYLCSLVRKAPDGYAMTLGEATRTLDQNAKLWPMLEDISRQVEWYGVRMNKTEWKDFFTAILKGQRSVPNPEATGFIVIGQRTSNMSKREFSDLIELIYAFGSERNVEWSEVAA